jgi:hypothetical protein
MKILPILLVLVIILSGLGLMVVLGGEETMVDDKYIEISTDKQIYYSWGGPVEIEISGEWASSSTYMDRGYVITDEDGHWVRDFPSLSTCDISISNGTVYYIWNQLYDIQNEYDLDGNPNVHYTNNGELVPHGTYYIHFIQDMHIFVEIVLLPPPLTTHNGDSGDL